MKKFSYDFSTQEEKLANFFLLRAKKAAPAVFPSEFYSLALEACGNGDVYCAALISHNVLRTLGRFQQAVAGSQDLNPSWFNSRKDDWIGNSSLLLKSLGSLRRDGQGDWGEWYHTFGIFAYAAHQMAVNGNADSVSLAASWSSLANPIINGRVEDPIKAMIDRDAADVAVNYVTKAFGDGAVGDCRSRESFVEGER